MVKGVADYSRSTLLEWARNHSPDLRIGRAMIDGRRVFFARFTYAGTEYEAEAAGDAPDEEIARTVVDMLRGLMNMPPLFEPSHDAELEEGIVRASIEGDLERRDQLTRQLVMGRQPRALRAKTRFDKREIW